MTDIFQLSSSISTPFCAREDFEDIHGMFVWNIQYGVQTTFCCHKPSQWISVVSFINWKRSSNAKHNTCIFCRDEKFMETVMFIEMVGPFSRAYFSDCVLWFPLDSIDSMRENGMIHIVRFKQLFLEYKSYSYLKTNNSIWDRNALKISL